MTDNIIVKKLLTSILLICFIKILDLYVKLDLQVYQKKKIEGDGVTPLGIFRLLSIYYREDRVGKIFTKLPKYKINRHMGWSDDPKDPRYNKLVRIPRKFGFEKIFREDRAYDIIITTDYNSNPVVPNKGSAIFIHCDSGSEHTQGCVSLKKRDILRILPNLSLQSRLIVR